MPSSPKNNERPKGGKTNNNNNKNIRKLNLLLKKTLKDYEQKVGES